MSTFKQAPSSDMESKSSSLQIVVIDANGVIKKDLGTVAFQHRNPIKQWWWDKVQKPRSIAKIVKFNATQKGTP